VVAHVARALVSAHALGVVHRDLKPENIFLVRSYDGDIAKVLDFGIARSDACPPEDPTTTRKGLFLGTPLYASPEQLRGEAANHLSDLWSLGVVAFQCLTGQPPFESTSLVDLADVIHNEPLPMPTGLIPSLPSGIDAWWERAAARDRARRFQSAKELADELGRALELTAIVGVPSVPLHARPMSAALDHHDVGNPMTTGIRLRRASSRVTPQAQRSLSNSNTPRSSIASMAVTLLSARAPTELARSSASRRHRRAAPSLMSGSRRRLSVARQARR
jgi:serine/threonine protein kinase